MALRMRIPSPVALPVCTALAVGSAPCTNPPQDAFLGVAEGEVINVTGGTVDGSRVYGVICGSPGGVREGWLPGSAVRLLQPAEAAQVPPEARLPARESLRRLTFLRVEEDWQNRQDPSTLGLLRVGDVLQLLMVQDKWAYGWLVHNPGRRGWFPLAIARPLESAMSSLIKTEEQELPQESQEALVDLLRSAPPPPRRPWTWGGDLPPVVEQSVHDFDHDWRESLAQMEAASAVAADPPSGGTYPAAEAEDSSRWLLSADSLPEDSYPLVVCIKSFSPPKGTLDALLLLNVGDLIRVTSLLETSTAQPPTMYHGFLEGRRSSRGWFPRSHVKLLEDPLAVDIDDLPPQIGPPPLPQVPDKLQRRGAQ